MAYQFNIHNHRVFEPPIIPIPLNAPPGSVTLDLTIRIRLVTVNFNRLTRRYSVANVLTRRINLDFDFAILEDESLLHQTLAPHLNGHGVNTYSVKYDILIREIMECGLRMADEVVNRGDNCAVLPLQANVNTFSIEYNYDDTRRALEESEAELERRNYGMVAAKGSSIEEMLNKVRVEDETDCMVCLEKLEAGRNASRMPCSHIFHADCIHKWLKQSHYCPICRYEMPTND